MLDTSWLEGIVQQLRAADVGRPCLLLDLDRVDHNLGEICASLSPSQFRIVTKSLPSVPLIRYVLEQTGSDKLMAFHGPYIPLLLEAFPGVDVMMGKPFPRSTVYECYKTLRQNHLLSEGQRVQWLVDSPGRLVNLIAVAREFETELRASIEVDVGLHRGGIGSIDELRDILSGIESTALVSLAGFMGYEGHVPFMPDPEAAFDRAMSKYMAIVDAGRREFPHLFSEPLCINSGGSKTLHRFAGHGFINDVSAGSAVVKPATFESLTSHRPAFCIAAPVIRRLPVRSNQAPSFCLYGGGWAAEIIYPVGVSGSPAADPPNQNLLPNQSVYHMASPDLLKEGDYVLFHPHQGDAMFQFEELLVLRDGEIVDRWSPFSLRY